MISVFAGIFNEDGKILLRRRKRESPNAPCPYEGDWELPGGTIEEENVWKAKDERIMGQELLREVKEETGLSIEPPFIPAMYPTVYVDEQKREIDIAFVIPIGTMRDKPTVGENTYASPKELRELAQRPKGERLVSGWGSRMCRMALMALHSSPNVQFRKDAQKILSEIQKNHS